MRANIWISSHQASEFLTKQLAVWPLARQNFLALDSVKTQSFDMGGFEVKVQFNPSRIISSGAKLDSEAIKERKCFLCFENLPIEQIKLPFGYHYLVLSNPYPIFKEHFTIPSRTHTDQAILQRFEDFLELTRRLDKHTIFYNGPKSGASAPDHAHFQAVSRDVMPLDYEWEKQAEAFGKEVFNDQEGGTIHTLANYLRNGFVIRSNSKENTHRLFSKLYHILPLREDETEPMMNIFGYYIDNTWVVVVIPRRAHRPKQFFMEGNEQIITSPGGADIGGLFITPREEDFNKISPQLLQDIYQQVCYSDKDIDNMANILR